MKAMHLRELLYQPVNFLLVACFVAVFGLTIVSSILDSAQLPNPVSNFGVYVGGKIIDHLSGTNK